MALIVLHLFAWFPIIVELTWWIRWIACFLSVVLLSVWIALCFTRRQGSDTLTSNVVFSFGIFISQCLLTEHRHDGYEHGLMQLFVVLCHCNIHPAALFIGLVLSLMQFLLHALRSLIWNPSGSPTSSLLLISEGLNQVLIVLIFLAFSYDFAHRVNNVLAGKTLRGDHMFDSPKKCRSRRWCWSLCFCAWIYWAAIVQFLSNVSQDHSIAGSYDIGNHLPISSMIFGFCSLTLMPCAARTNCPRWQADVIMATCSIPALLILLEALFISKHFCHLHNTTGELLELIPHVVSSGLCAAVVVPQTLLQAGCKPIVLLTCLVLLTVVLILLFLTHGECPSLHGQWSISGASPSNPLACAILVWIIVLSQLEASSVNEGSEEQGGEGVEDAIEMPSLEAAASAASLQTSPTSPVSALSMVSAAATQNFAGEAEPEQSDADKGESSDKPVQPLAVSVVRHAERGDCHEAFDPWATSQDAADFPHDPPITAKGMEQARKLAIDLENKNVHFWVVVSSPYLRCLQTALVLAEHFDAVVLIDQELGEVNGPDCFETEPPIPPRPWNIVKEAISKANLDVKRVKAGRLMGKCPSWPETLGSARVRYAKRFLDHLRRARHIKKSCLLVTHGHMVQVCAAILPATLHLKVVSVDYASAVLATCHRAGGRGDQSFQQSSFNEDDACQAGEEETAPKQQNEVMQAARLKYWNVWLHGVRYVSAPRRGQPAIMKQLRDRQDMLGSSWNDIVRLLGGLPVADEFPSPTSGDSCCSFSTNTHTESSMRMLRDPATVPESPADLDPRPKQSPLKMSATGLKLQLSTSSSRLAQRRKPPGGMSENPAPT